MSLGQHKISCGKYSQSPGKPINYVLNDRYNRKCTQSSIPTRDSTSPKKINDLSSLSPIFPSSAIKSSTLDDFFDFSKEKPELFTERTIHNPNSNSIDLTLGRSKNSYESQIKYMQEYISFLKSKARLSKNFESLEEEFEITTDQTSYNLALKAEIDYLNQNL